MIQELEKWKKNKKNVFGFTDSMDRLDLDDLKRMKSFVSNSNSRLGSKVLLDKICSKVEVGDRNSTY